jgi:hypothetical protein
MWIKLGTEHLNLDHVVRIRFNTAWKGGQEELVAELETFIDRETQVFCRYRGAEAERLYAVLQSQTLSSGGSMPILAGPPPLTAATQAGKSTVHDFTFP